MTARGCRHRQRIMLRFDDQCNHDFGDAISARRVGAHHAKNDTDDF